MSKRKEQAFIDLPRALREYAIDEFLAEGTQGSVYGAHHRTTGRKVVIKTLKTERDFVKEYSYALKVNYAHTVPLISFHAEHPHYFLVFPRLEKSLTIQVHEWKISKTPKEHREKEAAQLVRQLLPLLKHFAGLRVLHKDLHPGNILIQKGNYYVHDYGWADDMDKTQFGTLIDCLQLLRCARYMIMMDGWMGDFINDYNADQLPKWLQDCIVLFKQVPDKALVPYDRMLSFVGVEEYKSSAIEQGLKLLHKHRTNLLFYINQVHKTIEMNSVESKQILKPNPYLELIMTEFDGEPWVRIIAGKSTTLQAVEFLVKTPEFFLVFLLQNSK